MRMSRVLPVILALVLLAAALAAHAERKVHIYRPVSRTAAELEAPAQAALGNAGSATYDAGTNSLVLIGNAEAVESALAVLQQLDRPLATVVLHYESARVEELESRGIHVAWSVSAGSFRIGNVAAPPGTDLVAVRPFDDSKQRRGKFAGMLRVQDGQTGRIETGSELPIVTHVSPWETQVGVVSATSGFEARPQVLGDGRVRVQIQPFEGELQRGGTIRTGGAGTEITVTPGDTVAIGGITQSGEQRSRGLGGSSREERYEDSVLLLRTEVEGR
jgi:type II secretory pathway component GspD/PulD (secretin)